MEMDETRCHAVPFNNEMIDGRRGPYRSVYRQESQLYRASERINGALGREDTLTIDSVVFSGD
jgi:hypothetical protein